jgi:MFS family permease
VPGTVHRTAAVTRTAQVRTGSRRSQPGARRQLLASRLWATSYVSVIRNAGGEDGDAVRTAPTLLVWPLGTLEATSGQPGRPQVCKRAGAVGAASHRVRPAIASIVATAAGIALPAIGRDFNTSLAIAAGGHRLHADSRLACCSSPAPGRHVQPQRVFLTGAVWFALASLRCGVAPDALFLIVARAVQGIGGPSSPLPDTLISAKQSPTEPLSTRPDKHADQPDLNAHSYEQGRQQSRA